MKGPEPKTLFRNRTAPRVGDNTFFVVYHPRDQRAVPLDPAFLGFGRTGTDPDGALWFETVKPELVPFDATTIQAPHTCVAVFGRDL